MKVESLCKPVETACESLVEALALGFNEWANGATDEFSIRQTEYTNRWILTTWEAVGVIVTLTPTSPNWENSDLAFLCRDLRP